MRRMARGAALRPLPVAYGGCPGPDAPYLPDLAAEGTARMSYWIEFYEQGNKIGETPAPGSEEEAREHAKQGLVTHKADFARIVDASAERAEVWSVHADTDEARISKP